MQQRTRRLAVLIGGTFLASLGLFVVACSTDNGTIQPLPGQIDSGKPKETGTSSGTSSGTSGSSGAPDADAEAGAEAGPVDCSEAPVLRSNDKNGFYCAFLKARDAGATDAGGAFNCSDDETCCQPKMGAFCALAGAKGQANSPVCAAQAVVNGFPPWVPAESSTWECGDKDNCGANQVCCIYTKVVAAGDKVNIGKYQNTTKVPAACNAEQVFKYGGTRCATACAADMTEIQMCSKSDPTCAGGKTCSPFEVVPGGRELAYCK